MDRLVYGCIICIFCMQVGFSQLIGNEKIMCNETNVKYYLYLPDDYQDSKDQNFPLVVFLHGGGESGDDLEMVKVHGLPKLAAEGYKFPFIMLAPLNGGKRQFWDDALLMNLIDYISDSLRVDVNRIYLTGMSRGGYGAWRLALNNPDKFAALAVICGASAPAEYAEWIKEVPIWVFHGAIDKVIPVSVSENMVQKLKAAGADVTFTIYPDADHDAWTRTYENPKLYEWFLSHSLKE